MTLMEFLQFVAGLVLLVGGAELLVRGASRLAAAWGISSLVIGLTVVAYGTSAPELAVTVQSSLAGTADLGLGNVVGSNIANVLLILGLSALVFPLSVSSQLIRLEVPIMIGVSCLLWLVVLDGNLGPVESIAFLLGAIGYSAYTIIKARKAGLDDVIKEVKEEAVEKAKEEGESKPGLPPPMSAATGWRAVAWNLALVTFGLVMLVFGADWIVDGATVIAKAWGIDELLIGLTIVAVGTSLPEVATSLMATLRGERDIAVGNAIGSNLFNILLVLGAGGSLAPGGVPVSAKALGFDIPFMVVVAMACFPVFLSGRRIARWEGAMFLLFYVLYIAYLGLRAANHELLPAFGMLLLFSAPITLATLGVIAFKDERQRSQAKPTQA